MLFPTAFYTAMPDFSALVDLNTKATQPDPLGARYETKYETLCRHIAAGEEEAFFSLSQRVMCGAANASSCKVL